MKKWFIILFLLHSKSSLFCQLDTIIHPGQVSLAILQLNYSNYSLEGAKMMYFDCPTCTADSIPFDILYEPPMDAGQICIRLAPTEDTLFRGTIFWAGSGQIYFPSDLIIDSPFLPGTNVASFPNYVQYLNNDGQQTMSPSQINNAFQCWNALKNLEVMRIFSSYGYRAAVYFYPPQVGAFYEGYAKWIVFLYHVDDITSTTELTQVKPGVYPIPFTDKINVSNIPGESITGFVLWNEYAEIVKSGSLESGEVRGLNELSPGNYYMVLNVGDSQVVIPVVK